MADKKRTKTIGKVVAPMRVVDTEAARHRRVAQRAYERYSARGYVDGHDVEDWLAAEADV